MRPASPFAKRAVAAIALAVTYALPAAGQEADLQALLSQLRDPALTEWEPVERQIHREWARSGSPAMDLLLERGREALNEGAPDVAVEHLGALTDHAPDFAEGWNARASAFFQMGLYGLSLADIQRTLALNPDHFGALSGLGRILEELDRKPQALEAYRAALRLHPHRPDLLDAVDRLEAQVDGTEL